MGLAQQQALFGPRARQERGVLHGNETIPRLWQRRVRYPEKLESKGTPQGREDSCLGEAAQQPLWVRELQMAAAAEWNLE